MSQSDHKAGIGTLNEKSLHAQLKSYLAQPGDEFEVKVDGSIIDIVRGRELIEVQTRGFSPLKRKLHKLTQNHPVRLVYPVPQTKWVVKADPQTEKTSRRRSPKKGSLYSLFSELVYLPTLLEQPNFTLEVLLIEEEDWRRPGKRRRRWGWVTFDRRLVQVKERRKFHSPADLATLLPTSLATTFTTKELAQGIGHPRRVAQQMAYCLRAMNVITIVGKKRNALLYSRSEESG